MPKTMEDGKAGGATADALTGAFRRAAQSLENAESALRAISIARLPALRTALEQAASDMAGLRQEAAATATALRRSAAFKAAAADLTLANRRLQALYRAATDFHALLMRARSVEQTGYGPILQTGSSTGACPLSPGHQLRVRG
jgi:hypothetical protein